MESNKVHYIDLKTFRTPNSRVFTTRPRGLDVRKRSKIDELEPLFDNIIIVIPNDISSINPSFLEEFLESVVLKLGADVFYKKFSFTGQGKYKIDVDLEEAVDRILRSQSSLH